MVKTGIFNITIQKNRDNEFGFTMPYDITDLTYASEIRDSANNLITTFVISKDVANRIVWLRLLESQTLNITNSHLYDLKQTDLTGFDKTIIKGNVSVEQTITQ